MIATENFTAYLSFMFVSCYLKTTVTSIPSLNTHWIHRTLPKIPLRHTSLNSVQIKSGQLKHNSANAECVKNQCKKCIKKRLADKLDN